MNMTIKLSGLSEKIMEGAVKAGLAKTKTDAIMLGLVALDYKYSLLEQMEDAEDAREAERVSKEIKIGKQRLHSKKEFEKNTGLKLDE